MKAADESPASADDFMAVSKGRPKPHAQRMILDSIDEDAADGSHKAPKRRAKQGARQPAIQDTEPHTTVPAANTPAAISDEMTQDVHGTANSAQMQFQACCCNHTHSLLHTLITSLAARVWGMCAF